MPEASPYVYYEPCADEYDVVTSAPLADDRTVYSVAEPAPVEFTSKN